MSQESFIDRVELLKKVGKLKFHFPLSPPSTKSDHTLAPIKLYSIKNSVILVREVSSQETKSSISKSSEHSNTFQLDLPFEISILTLDDNFKKAISEPNFRRVITLGFKLVNKENINFDMIETDLDDLDERLGQIWDAKHFEAVESILCLKCQSSFLTQLLEEDISLIPIPTQEKCIEKTTNEAAYAAALLPEEEIALDFSNLSITKEDPPVANVVCTATKQPLFTRFRNLPNEGWEELVDCWVCHSEDYTPHFYKLFCPNPSTLLVGANYLLVNISRLANVSDNKKILCPTCQASLGEILTDSQMVTSVNIASPQEVAKIYKLSIATQHSSLEKQPICTLPWSATILSDLIGKHRYRSASRFVLNSWESNMPAVLLMVVNWDNYHWKHQASEGKVFQPHQLSHSVYIKYLEISNATEKSLVESWTLDDSVIALSYPEAYITEVLANIVNFENLLSSPFKTDLFKNGYIMIPETQP